MPICWSASCCGAVTPRCGRWCRVTVHLRKSLHLRDLKLLLAGGEVHATKKLYERLEVGSDPVVMKVDEEVVCTIRLCPDVLRYVSHLKGGASHGHTQQVTQGRTRTTGRDGTDGKPTLLPRAHGGG